MKKKPLPREVGAFFCVLILGFGYKVQKTSRGSGFVTSTAPFQRRFWGSGFVTSTAQDQRRRETDNVYQGRRSRRLSALCCLAMTLAL